MKSGLEDRNNTPDVANLLGIHRTVSMKSGLEDRNNALDVLLVRRGIVSQ